VGFDSFPSKTNNKKLPVCLCLSKEKQTEQPFV